MNLSPRSLVLLVLLAPLTSFGESYEWFDRIESTEGGPRDTVTTEVFQVAPSELRDLFRRLIRIAITRGVLVCCPSTATRTANSCGAGNSAFDARSRKPTRSPSMPPAYSLPAYRTIQLSIRWSSCCGFVRLYSHDGDTLWTRRNLQWPEVAADSVADDTGVYVVGGKNNNRMVVHRLSNTGETLWTRVMLSEGSGNLAIELADNHLYVLSRSQQDIITIRASDGASLGAFRIPRGYREVRIMSYHDGFLYLGGFGRFSKFSVAGDPMWRYFSNYWFLIPIRTVCSSAAGSWPRTTACSFRQISAGHVIPLITTG